MRTKQNTAHGETLTRSSRCAIASGLCVALLCVQATATSIRFEVDSKVSGFANLPIDHFLPTGKILGGSVDLVLDEASGRIGFSNVDLRQVDAPLELLLVPGTPTIEVPIVDTSSEESSLYNQILSNLEGSLNSDNLIQFGDRPPGWHYSWLTRQKHSPT